MFLIEYLHCLSLIGWTQNTTCLHNAHLIICIADCSCCRVFSWMDFSVDYKGNNKTASSSLQFTCFSITIWHFSTHMLKRLCKMFFFAWGGVYPHQECPLVHLLWFGPNTMLLFLFFFFAFTLPFLQIVNKTTCVLRSSIHWTEILKQGNAGRRKEEVQKTG